MCLPIALVLKTVGGILMDSYIYAIAALLPLAAIMLVLQTNPYHALVIRGILGAVAALVYTVLGAADVALTEALVGTLLAITLYAVAVRSSLVLRLGVLKDDAIAVEEDTSNSEKSHFRQLINDLQTIFSKRYMRVEIVSYQNKSDLHMALMDKEVHAVCTHSESQDRLALSQEQLLPYSITIRLHRLYEIVQTELASPITNLNYISPSDSEEAHP